MTSNGLRRNCRRKKSEKRTSEPRSEIGGIEEVRLSDVTEHKKMK